MPQVLPALSIGEAEDFLKRAAVDGRIARPWSEVMRKRIAGDLLSTLADFGLLEDLKRPTKPIRSYRLLPDTVLFLAHEIHFKGFSDNSILESPDWQLFGLKPDLIKGFICASHRDAIFAWLGWLLSKCVLKKYSSRPLSRCSSFTHTTILGTTLPNPDEGFSGVGESHQWPCVPTA